MHKSSSMQKAVKKVIQEKDSWESYQRVKGENCFSFILAHMLSCWVPAMGAVYSFLPRSFLMFSQCNKASLYAANMMRKGSKVPLRKPNYQAGPWKYWTCLFSVVLIPWHLWRDVRNRWWQSGGGSFVVSRANHLHTTKMREKEEGLNLSSCLKWVVISPQSSVVG